MEYFTLSFIVGILLGFLIVRYITNKLKILQQPKIDITHVATLMLLKTEKYNDLLYLYNLGNGSFISQGSTLQELAANTFNYKKITMAMVSHNKTLFYFFEGKVFMFKDEECVEVTE